MLLEAVEQFRKQQSEKIKLCIVGEWAVNLSETDKKAFLDVCEDFSISTRKLLTVLKTAGASFSLEAIRKHRNGECPCQA